MVGVLQHPRSRHRIHSQGGAVERQRQPLRGQRLGVLGGTTNPAPVPVTISAASPRIAAETCRPVPITSYSFDGMVHSKGCQSRKLTTTESAHA